MSTCLLAAFCAGTKRKVGAQTSDHQATRPISIVDVIGMTRLADRRYTSGGSSAGIVANFSPDGKKFVVVVTKGNQTDNTNEYSVLLWHVNSSFAITGPETLLMLSSSSNREAISDLKWLPDGDTIAFLGEHPNEVRELYTFNIKTRVLDRITHHATNLISYSMADSAKKLAFIAEEPTTDLFDKTTARNGLVISGERLFELVKGTKGGQHGNSGLFFQDDKREVTPISLSGRLLEWSPSGPWLSPSGQYIVVALQTKEIPDAWKDYSDPSEPRLMALLRSTSSHEQYTIFRRYVLIDTSSGKQTVLLDSPIGNHGSEVAWSPHSDAVAITNVYLPLAGATGGAREARRVRTFTIELTLRNREVTEITPDTDLKLLSWDSQADQLVFTPGRTSAESASKPRHFLFRKTGAKWEEISGRAPETSLPEIVMEEDMNTPPKIFAIDSRSGQKSILLDLNPEFKHLTFARVEQVEWLASDGRIVKGGLYYPVAYRPGQRYPLVIQTHGFNPHRFWMDGPWTTAFAAQPLAGRGMMVLQTDEDLADLSTPKEAPAELASLEGAIDYLGGRGFIDRTRVGLLGFSRTCLHVKYALTHSKYAFSAASVSDGVDGGYFQYLLTANASEVSVKDNERINGGPPFGQGLKSWLERSPGFSIDKVRAPIRIVAPTVDAVMGEWEWFAALSRLGHPVEMIEMQDGEHILQKPWHRLVSQGGNVDWFAFWLKGEEDSDPAKRQQYARWRKMRLERESGESSKSRW